jgi:hypothetical protein
MNGSRWVGPVAGLGFAAAVLVEAVAFPDGASSADPPTAIAGYYQHRGGTDLVVDYISLAAVPLLLLFLCTVITRLAGTAARFAQAAAVAGAVFELVATAIEMTLAGGVGGFAPATTTAALFDVSSRMFFVSMLWLGLAIGTVAVASPSPAWQRWLGGLAGGVMTAAGCAVAHPHGPLGALLLPAEGLLVIWVVTTAITGFSAQGEHSQGQAGGLAAGLDRHVQRAGNI